MNIRKQIKNNLVAIVSLVVALTSLSYAAWRNELTEENRNVRTAGFEMLIQLGTLQQIIYLGHYDADQQGGNPRLGWVQVMVLRDLGAIMPEPLPRQSQALLKIWEDNWSGIGSDTNAVTTIDDQLEKVRQTVITTLNMIE